MKIIHERFFKKTLLSALIVCFSLVSFATTYYVSNAGDDANSGLTEEVAWKTLTKVNATTFSPGDQILFKKADTFYGSLIIGQSGTTGNPITFGAYGTGTNPVITGFTEVDSWTDKGGNIWESTNAASTLSTCNMVVISGENTPMGRTPNSGYYYFQSHSDNYHITSNNLTGTPDWTGAELAFNPNNWDTRRVPITDQSTNTLTFEQPETFTIGYDNLKFIIQNDIRTLDQQNEWYYNPSTKKISIYSTSDPTDVNIATIDTLVNIYNKNYITFQNIKFEGSNEKSICIRNSNNITINNCVFECSGFHGIYGGGFSVVSDSLTVTNCTFDSSNNGAVGVTQYFTNANISYNTISNSGMIYGANCVYSFGTNNSGFLYGISAIGSGSIIEHNTVTNTGYVGIRYLGSNTTVRYNYVNNYCQVNHDGGGIYTWNGHDYPFSGTEVYNNIVINDIIVKEVGHNITMDAGIYLDSPGSNGIEVSYNTVEVPLGVGILVNGGHDLDVNHNNVFNSIEGIRFRHDYISNVSATYNTVIAKSSSQYVYRVFPAESVRNEITSDFNILDRPIDSTDIIWCYIGSPTPYTDYQSLGEWQSYSEQDANSHESPVSITSESDLQFEYNASDSIATISLNTPMVDLEGNKYAYQVTLQPYSSIILIKDPHPEEVPEPALYLDFEEGSGTTAIDSGYGENDGTLIGDSVVRATGGIRSSLGETDGCVEIVGESTVPAYIKVPHAAYMNDPDYTVSVWVKWRSSTMPYAYVFWNDGSVFPDLAHTRHIDMWMRPDTHRSLSSFVHTTDSSTNQLHSTDYTTNGVDIYDNQWHLLTMTMKGKRIRVLYTDSIETARDTLSLDVASNTVDDLWIGSRPDGTNTGLNLFGWMDRARLWEVALSEAQIKTLFEEENPGKFPDPVLFLDFEEGAGTTVIDSGYGENDGTLMGDSLVWTTGGIYSSEEEPDGCVEIVGESTVPAYIKVPHAAYMNDPDYTVSVWVKWRSSSMPYAYVFWNDGDIYPDLAHTRHIDMYMRPNTYRSISSNVHVADNTVSPLHSTDYTTNGIDIYDSEWHLLTMTMKDKRIRVLYTDSIETARDTLSLDVASNTLDDLWIGSRPDGANAGLNLFGWMDRARLWEVTLTPDQVKALYKSEGPGGGTGLKSAQVFIKDDNSSLADTRIEVYPNPAKGQVMISEQQGGEGRYRIELYDFQGAEKYSTGQGVFLPYQLDISGLRPGMYFIRILPEDKSKTIIKKIIKQ